MSTILACLTVIASANAVGDEVPSLAIFNQWKYENPPVLFNWQDQKETAIKVKSLSNPMKMQIKWSCSAQLNGKMYIFGGQPDGGETVKNVFEIKDCGIVDTKIALPWPLAGHSCSVNEGYVYICGSLYRGDKCTKFDGKSFYDISSTKTGHTYGAMVSYKESPIILGGGSTENQFNVDYDQVEQLGDDNGDANWVSIPSMLEPMRHFSAISYLNPVNKFEVMITFGGYSSAKKASLIGSYWYHGGYWFQGPDMLAPRMGHQTVMYEASQGVTSLLHIGGDSGEGREGNKLPIERWDLRGNYVLDKQNSTLVLDTYKLYPEVFAVSSSFCN